MHEGMENRASVAAVVLITMAIVCSASARAHGVQRLDNGRWLDGERFVPRVMYVVEGVFRSHYEGAVDQVIDLGDGYVIPPFGDAHNHALADPRFEEESADFLEVGIFYVANPNSIGSLTAAVRPAAARPETVDVTYANGGLTSTGGHPSQIYDRMARHIEGWTAERMVGEAYFVIDQKADLDRVWHALQAGKPDFVKVYLEHAEEHASRRLDSAFVGQRALDPLLLPAIVERAHASGLRVAAHVTSAFDFRTAVAAGVDEIAHLPLERITVADAERAAAAGVTLTTTTLSHRPVPEGVDVDALHRHNLALLRDHGVGLVLGTDSHASVIDEAENLYRLGMFDRATLVRLLTEATPRWIFPERAIGRLVDGFEGSLLVLEGNPLEELAFLRKIVLRLKRGHLLPTGSAAGRKPVADRLAGVLMHGGAEAALAELRRIEREEADAYEISEAQLNAVGYAALEHGRAADAVAVFTVIVERFPASANAHDSLGDGYTALGDRPRAIESYRRALELSPDLAVSQEKLEALLAEGARD